MPNLLLKGDSGKVLLAFKSESIPLIATDPQYGIGFMSKDWDKHLPHAVIWAECYRVLKPGAFILVMASPRNDDLVSIALREAGFIKHNSIYWVYGSGFPKGTDCSKTLDAQAVRDWLKDKDHGLTAKEVRKVISAAVNGEFFPASHRETDGNLAIKSQANARERRTAGARLIESLESRFGEMPKRVKVGGGKGTSWKKQDAINLEHGYRPAKYYEDNEGDFNITAPATPLAAEYEGMKYGIQSLKPSAEVILVFQKPFDGKPIDSIVRHGVGAVNVDAGRISYEDTKNAATNPKYRVESGCKITHGKKIFGGEGGEFKNQPTDKVTSGRYPSNFLLSHVPPTEHSPGCRVVGERRVKGTPKSYVRGADSENVNAYGKGIGEPAGKLSINYADADGKETVTEYACVEGCPVRELDLQSGVLKSGEVKPGYKRGNHKEVSTYGEVVPGSQLTGFGDTGTASRFFYQPEWSNADIPPFKYCAKASSRERNAGCEGLEQKKKRYQDGRGQSHECFEMEGCGRKTGTVAGNPHPTVKPVELFRYLIKLFIGKGRIVLDPFVGSGTTLIAALLENVKAIGIDAELEYLEIAAARERHWAKNLATYLTTGQIPVVREAALPLFDK